MHYLHINMFMIFSVSFSFSSNGERICHASDLAIEVQRASHELDICIFKIYRSNDVEKKIKMNKMVFGVLCAVC